MAGKFKKGDRVVMSSPESGVEPGTIIDEELPSYPGMYLVQATKQIDRYDDRLREVSEDQLTLVKTCPDCGEEGHGIGDMECQSPQDHDGDDDINDRLPQEE